MIFGLLISLLIFGGLFNKEAPKGTGIIPENAANVNLSDREITELLSRLAPLLRGEVSSFDSTETLRSGEVVSALLGYLCSENIYTVNESGAFLVPVSEVDSLYFSLFGTAAPRGDVGNTVVYNSTEEIYVFSGTKYRSDLSVEIISTRTLDDVIYVHLAVKAPLFPETDENSTAEESEVQSEAETGSDLVSDAESTESPVTSGTASDGVTSEGVTSEGVTSDISSSDVTSETESLPEEEFETLRNAVFTLKFINGEYRVTELRDA